MWFELLSFCREARQKPLKSAPFLLFLFAFSFFSRNFSVASSLTIGSAFETKSSSENSLRLTSILEHPLWNTLELNLGLEFKQSFFRFEGFKYKGEVKLNLSDFFVPQIRLSQTQLFHDHIGISSLLMLIQTSVPLGNVTFSFAGGWYEKKGSLSGITTFPSFWGEGPKDHDFAVLIAFKVRWLDYFYTVFKASTYEEMDVYRLNNPFGEISLLYSLSDQWVLNVYSRYKIFLGFGRLDSLVLGLNLRILSSSIGLE